MLHAVIVDDENMICQLILRLVDWEAQGVDVVGIAHNGQDALALAQEKDPDLIITDIRIPVFDGLELISRVQQAGLHARFIVVSASPTPIGIPDKATVTFTLRHERGTLMRALSSFVAMGMNMTHIESRPLHNSNWEYCFYVDLTGNLRDSNLGVLMGSLQGDCENCRLLGVYQAAREDAHV